MTDKDRETLEWLLAASPEELEKFYAKLDTQDVMHLLTLIVCDLNDFIAADDIGLIDNREIEDFTEAKQVLNKFRLKG